MKKEIISTLIAALIIYLLAYKFLEKVGLIKSKEEKETEKDFSASGKFEPFEVLFTPNFIFEYYEQLDQNKKNTIWNTFNPQQAKYEQWAQNILGAKNVLNDDEEEVFSVFRSIATLEELAWFSWKFLEYCNNNPTELAVYYMEFGANLSSLGMYLDSFLDSDDKLELKNIMKQYKSIFA